MTVPDPSAGERSRLPVRRITMSQLVAYNTSFFRRAAGLEQREFGQELGGWSFASVSAAERSWESKRIKKFDADEIMQIADVLGVPLAALFLPPEDHGTAVRYVWHRRGREDMDLTDLLRYLFPEHEGDSPAMDAYRLRMVAARAGRDPAEDNLAIAARVLELAQRTADEAIDQARTAADKTFGRARGESDMVLAEARRQAEQITADTAAKAMALERDAQERHRQALGDLVQQREELARRVYDLRAFERDYRARLQAFFEGQLKDLWASDMRPQVVQAVLAARKRAKESPGQHVSALLLREDMTYEVLQLPYPQEIPQADKERQTAEEDSAP